MAKYGQTVVQGQPTSWFAAATAPVFCFIWEERREKEEEMRTQREAGRARVEKRDIEGGRKLSTLLLFLQEIKRAPSSYPSQNQIIYA